MIRYIQDILAGQDSPQGEAGLETLRAAFRRLPALESERLLLRQPRVSDAADYYAYARDSENSRYVLWEPHRSVLDSRDALRSIISQNRRGLPATFAIELKSERRMIGTIGFQCIDAENLSAEVGYTIARRLWNRGLATEALETLLRYAFTELNLNRVEAKHDVLNPASGRVMLRAGFHEEGLARQSVNLKGRMADMMRYAILRDEWEKR